MTAKLENIADFGSSSDRADHLATESLVVMAVGLRTHWKQPIAYFLVDKNGRKNSKPDSLCCYLLPYRERGFHVDVTVCEGNFANQNNSSVIRIQFG